MAHSAQKGSILVAKLSEPNGMSRDQVSLTVLGIQSVIWNGKANGFDSPSGPMTSDTLDNDPNWPAGLAPGSVRVFPGGRMGSEATAKNRVKLAVTLSVEPVEPVSASILSVDVDDPTDDKAPVDNDSAAGAPIEDNRGEPVKAGIFPSSNNNRATINFVNPGTGQPLQEVSVEFQVTMQPGDNFRVVASPDADFLMAVENNDGNQGPNNSDRQRIVHPDIAPGGTWADREVRKVAQYTSKVLTVWRLLHVEVDSMGPVMNNFKEGLIQSFDAPSSVNTKEVITDIMLHDNSPDLDDPNPAPGRFERGTLEIAGTHMITDIEGNGNDFFRKTTGGLNVAAQPLPFTATSGIVDNNGNPLIEMDGWVTAIEGFGGQLVLEVVNITMPFDDLTLFIDGTIRIAGGPPMTIFVTTGKASDPAPSVEVDTLRVPFRAVDDDSRDASGNYPPLPEPPFAAMEAVYGEAYILPIRDTGQDTPNAPFHLHTNPINTDAQLNESRGSPFSTDIMWFVLAKTTYQRHYFQGIDPNTGTTMTGDNDPDSEGTARARASPDAHGIIMAEESIRDWIATLVTLGGAGGIDPDQTGAPNRQTRREEILNHEIGHLFGLTHGHGVATVADPFGGLMQPSCCPANLRQSSTFTRISLDITRNRSHPGN